MTKQELNRDIKRLDRKVKRALRNLSVDGFFKQKELNFKPEFLRLYNADNTMKSMNKQSILIMLALNVSHRFLKIHQFYPHEK